MKNRNIIFGAILSVLACFAFLPQMQAADGDLGGGNTSEGFNALNLLTTGQFNTGLGWYSLGFNLTDGNFNTAVGAGALDLNNGTSNTAVGTGAMLLNIVADRNTAVGTDALLFNDFTATSPPTATDNTAVGFQALLSNLDGGSNTAVGSFALSSNDISGNGFANGNTAVGFLALTLNVDGDSNTAVGSGALILNDGISNNAIGRTALQLNTTGSFNQAMGVNALVTNDSGFGNIAIGDDAMFNNVSGVLNTVVGDLAGNNIVTFGGNIYIGVGVPDPTVVPDEVAFIRIGTPTFTDPIVGTVPYDTFISGIFDRDVDVTTARFVFVDANQKVGTELVDAQGNRFTVPMPQTAPAGPRAPEAAKHALLELKVKELQATVAQQQKQIEALTAGLQKVSAQIEVNKPAPRVVENR